MSLKTLLIVGSALIFSVTAAPALAVQITPATADLTEVLRDGVVIADHNHDGAADYIDGGLWAGAHPDAPTLAAAATIAARLGYEVSSLDLPALTDARRARVIVGRGAAVEAAALAVPRIDAAAPGRGRIFRIGSEGKLVVAGPDAVGTQAAAAFAAAWLPGPGSNSAFAPLLGELGARLSFPANKGPVVTMIEIGADGQGVIFVDSPHAGVIKAGDLAGLFSPFPGRWTLRVGGEAVVDLAQVKVQAAPTSAPAPRKTFDLARFYSVDGVLGDSDGNLLPDRLDVRIAPSDSATPAIVDLAARMGLETSGYRSDLVAPADQFDPARQGHLDPASQPSLVLIGQDHPLVQGLIARGAYGAPSLAPGEGSIAVVDRAFGAGAGVKPAIVLSGGDAAGLDRAVGYLARKLPNIGPRGEDRASFDDLAGELVDVVASRSAAGQAARADWELTRLLATLPSDVSALTIKASVVGAEPGLARYLEARAQAVLPAARIEARVENRDVAQAHRIVVDGAPFAIDQELPSETDAFRQLVREKVVAAVQARPGAPVYLEARLSEAPETRQKLAREARAILVAAGARPDAVEVRVLSAYKQGFSWLDEVVIPQLVGKGVERVEIRFAKLTPPKEWPQQSMLTPTRWLNEIYPIDAIIERKLGLAAQKLSFVEAQADAPAYEVTAFGPGGAVVFKGDFDPKVVLRSAFDIFPDYEKVRVTTGWLTAKVDDRSVVDQRLETDLERLWDIYQGQVLPAVYKHVMAVSDGKPRPADAPFFGELRILANLSEPDYRLGVGEEVVSAIDGINQDLLFFTRSFFQQLGLRSVGAELGFAGRILPMVRPALPGEAQHVKIDFTAFDAPRPRLSVDWITSQGQTGGAVRDLPRLKLERPRLTTLTVGPPGTPVRARFELPVSSMTDDLEARLSIVRLSGVRAAAQRTFVSAEQVRGQLEALSRLRAAGLYRSALAAEGLGDLVVTPLVDGAPIDEVRLPANGAPAPPPALPACRLRSARLVQTDHAIDPVENAEIIACLARYKGVRPYRVGKSYLGRDIWAMDVGAPQDGAYFSRFKLSVAKPTAFISARVHANEVSSTTHTLSLLEDLLKSRGPGSWLDRINLVVQPIYNVDGAAQVKDLETISPNLLMHAARFGALGEDLRSSPPDPSLVPEGPLRQKLWSMWLPDVFMDPHGLAAHEWVSPFGEYVGWPMSRSFVVREVWAPRGWHIPGFNYPSGEAFAANRAFAFDVLAAIGRGMAADPRDVQSNRDLLDRWMRYGTAFDPVAFPVNRRDGVLVYFDSLSGTSRREGGGWEITNPEVTVWSGATEAPDEPARGAWLQKVTAEGLIWDRSILGLLAERAAKPDKTAAWSDGAMRFVTTRDRAPSVGR